ncbi:MAG: hypothetical protein LUP97_05225 [Methanoregula sp.]|nr:hypothetical protein [Methanoregula sp.]
MGDLYLNYGESIVLTANKVLVNFVPFDVILTTSRLIFVDSTYARFDPQMIPLEDIFSVKGGEIATGEPTITLTIARTETPEQPESTELFFSQERGERRMPESREWLRKLMEAIVAVRQKSTVTDSRTAEAETGMRPSIRRWIAPEILAPHKVVTDPQPPAPEPDAAFGPADVAPAPVSQSPEENLPESGKSPEVTDTESPIADETHSPSEEKIQERGSEEKPPSAFREEPIEAPQPGPGTAHAEDEPIRPVPGDSPETPTTPEEEQSTIPDRSQDLPLLPEVGGRDETPDQNPVTPPASSEREVIDDTGIRKESGEPVSETPYQDLPEDSRSGPNREAGDIPNAPLAITWPIIPAPAIEFAAPPAPVNSDEPLVVALPQEEKILGEEGSEIARQTNENREIPGVSPVPEEKETGAVTDSPDIEKNREEFSGPEEAETGETVSERPGEVSGREDREGIPETAIAPGTDPVTGSTDHTGSSDKQENPSGRSTLQSGDSEKPAEEAPIAKIPEEILPPPPQRDSPPRIKMAAAIVFLAVLLIALAGIALIASPPFNGDTTPVTTPVSTPVPTPSPTIAASPPSATIPGTGVYLKVIYNHHYYGQIGNPGDLLEISDTGDKFYVIPSKGNLVQIRVEKQDNTGDPLTVEIYRNGAIVRSEMIRTPMGEISLLIDPSTEKPPGLVTPEQQ